jgi:hypothetical protein
MTSSYPLGHETTTMNATKPLLNTYNNGEKIHVDVFHEVVPL